MITGPLVIRKFLLHLKLPPDPLPIAPAREPRRDRVRGPAVGAELDEKASEGGGGLHCGARSWTLDVARGDGRHGRSGRERRQARTD
jgi:hypothetical protein